MIIFSEGARTSPVSLPEPLAYSVLFLGANITTISKYPNFFLEKNTLFFKKKPLTTFSYSRNYIRSYIFPQLDMASRHSALYGYLLG